MSSTFPTTLDSFTDPTATSKLNAPSNSAQHADKNDAIEKLEAKVGVNSSAVTTTHDYKLSGITGTDKASSKTAEETLLLKTLTTPIIAAIYQDAGKTKLMTLPNTASDTLVSLAATQELVNKTLNTTTIKPVAGYAPTTAGLIGFNDTTKKLVYGNGTTTIIVGQQNRAFAWYLDGTSIVADEVGAKYIAPQAMTAVRLEAKTVSGTATIRVQTGTTTIEDINVTSTVSGEDVTTSPAISQYSVITLDITAASTCVGLTVTLECTQP